MKNDHKFAIMMLTFVLALWLHGFLSELSGTF